MMPPYRPERPKMLDELVPYPSFEALMHDYGKADWLEDPPDAKDQKYFSNWYVACVGVVDGVRCLCAYSENVVAMYAVGAVAVWFQSCLSRSCSC